jgi:hypothetical protein
MVIDHGKVIYAEKEPGRDVTVSQHPVVPYIFSPPSRSGLVVHQRITRGFSHIPGIGHALTVSASNIGLVKMPC